VFPGAWLGPGVLPSLFSTPGSLRASTPMQRMQRYRNTRRYSVSHSEEPHGPTPHADFQDFKVLCLCVAALNAGFGCVGLLSCRVRRVRTSQYLYVPKLL
jgi:hypothetical protein